MQLRFLFFLIGIACVKWVMSLRIVGIDICIYIEARSFLDSGLLWSFVSLALPLEANPDATEYMFVYREGSQTKYAQLQPTACNPKPAAVFKPVVLQLSTLDIRGYGLVV